MVSLDKRLLLALALMGMVGCKATFRLESKTDAKPAQSYNLPTKDAKDGDCLVGDPSQPKRVQWGPCGSTVPETSIDHGYPNRDISPGTVKDGQTVCVFSVVLTKELHAWVPPGQFYISPNCIMTATKTVAGYWLLNLKGVKLFLDPADTDAKMRSYGWVMMDEVVAQ